MPTVNKETPAGIVRTKPGSIALQIRPVADVPRKGVTLSIYGKGKTGKTRLACTFPKPMLLIGTEDGSESVRGRVGVDFVRIMSANHLEDLCQTVATGKSFWKGKTKLNNQSGDPYLSACLDTGGGLQDIVLKEFKGLDEIPVQLSWGIATQQDWGGITEQWKEHVRRFIRLAETHQKHIAIIAHEREFKSDDRAEVSDIIIPNVGSALTPKATAWLNGAVSYIGQTFIRDKLVQKPAAKGVKGAEMEWVASGEYEFCLRVGPHPVFMTGFRVDDGIDVPDAIVNPTFEKIMNVIKGEPVEA
jgi:hypothetical protein